MSEQASDHRRATAQRNVESILDAVEALVERGSQVSVTGVAAQAGVSRVTVYAHFPAREDLLAATVARAVKRATAALETAEPQRGPAAEALERVIAVAWSELERNSAIAQAGGEHLKPAELTRAHETAMRPVRGLITRGRKEGVFRDDLPTDWLVTCFFALMHACGDQVRAGALPAAAAPGVLTTTIRGMFLRQAG
jgi:AcrR family transcriptional regulator